MEPEGFRVAVFKLIIITEYPRMSKPSGSTRFPGSVFKRRRRQKTNGGLCALIVRFFIFILISDKPGWTIVVARFSGHTNPSNQSVIANRLKLNGSRRSRA